MENVCCISEIHFDWVWAFSDNEIDLAEKNGFISVSLGNNRLRTETAAIAATQILSAYNADI